MKQVIAILLVVAIIFSIPCEKVSAKQEAFYTERKNRDHEEWLWNELSQHSPNDYTTAAVLSYFWRESQYRSDAVAGYGSTLVVYGIDLCADILEKTDKGLEDGSSRSYFLKKARLHGGYGLGQWYSMGYLETLYDFAVEYGTSIGDAQMQCAFVFYSIKQDDNLWKKLKKCKSAEEAGYLVAVLYDGTEHGADYIKYKSKTFYDRYHVEEEENELSGSTCIYWSSPMCRTGRIFGRPIREVF